MDCTVNLVLHKQPYPWPSFLNKQAEIVPLRNSFSSYRNEIDISENTIENLRNDLMKSLLGQGFIKTKENKLKAITFLLTTFR